jgi:hypothetical protein
MEDYPRNINELEARFGTEEACHEYLFRLRWPDGFRCPYGENTRRGVGAGEDGIVGVYDGFLPCAISLVGHAFCPL